MQNPIRIVGGGKRVVDADGLSIDELIGNVATNQDTLSVAKVCARAGTSEPWLTLHYNEWMCVVKGTVVLTQSEDTKEPPIHVKAGETVEIASGTRFRPCFPEDAEYIPVCLPAFKPERCIREDTNGVGEAISANLKRLHSSNGCAPGGAAAKKARSIETAPETLYHMCPERDWEAAKSSGKAYYPPTFEQDEHLTHATGVPSRLVATANHYYTDSPGKWICLEFTRTALKDVGIYVRDEEATPVGDKPTSEELMGNWICPHIIGGIPLGVVSKIYDMTRDERGEKFTGIEGLV